MLQNHICLHCLLVFTAFFISARPPPPGPFVLGVTCVELYPAPLLLRPPLPVSDITNAPDRARLLAAVWEKTVEKCKTEAQVKKEEERERRRQERERDAQALRNEKATRRPRAKRNKGQWRSTGGRRGSGDALRAQFRRSTPPARDNKRLVTCRQ